MPLLRGRCPHLRGGALIQEETAATNRPDPESELILWSVSSTGKYARDCHTGSLYAFEALDYLVNNPTTDMGYLLSGIALAMIRNLVAEPSGIEVGFWGTIQKFAVLSAKHRGTAAQRAQVQNSYADYKRWLVEEVGAL